MKENNTYWTSVKLPFLIFTIPICFLSGYGILRGNELAYIVAVAYAIIGTLFYSLNGRVFEYKGEKYRTVSQGRYRQNKIFRCSDNEELNLDRIKEIMTPPDIKYFIILFLPGMAFGILGLVFGIILRKIL